MKQRIYNKLYVNKNRTDGSEKVLLGYRYNEREIVFKKDQETFFHVPVYATPIRLSESSLITNGATAGTFPAASDRIFKNLKSYGDVTPYGNPSFDTEGGYTPYDNPTGGGPANSTWFCSWLKYDVKTGLVGWVDRFYNLGRFVYEQAEQDLNKLPTYETRNPAFEDIPSTLVFEPQVLYKYFHVGDQTAAELLTSFEGVSSQYLGLHLKNWGTENVDKSTNKVRVAVSSNAPNDTLYSSAVTNPLVMAPSINFNHNYNVVAQSEWASSYTTEQEFTWSFWAHSENWQTNVSTQLFGNYSAAGEGIGIFIDTLESFPFIVIPETAYGRLLFINEGLEGYLDKAMSGAQTSLAPPSCFAINSERELIVCNDGRADGIYKFDHIGNVLSTTKNLNNRSNFFVFPGPYEKPKQVLCGPNDSIYVITNEGYYHFDKMLNFLWSVPINTENVIGAFSYTLSGDAKFELVSDVYDAKFIESDKWSLDREKGCLYKNDKLVYVYSDIATTLAVSPDDKLWVAHGENSIDIIDPVTMESSTFTVGTAKRTPDAIKTITFFKKYIREKNTTSWSGLILYSDEQVLYSCDLTGLVKSRVKLIDLLDYNQLQQQKQTEENSTFNALGDMTGYERNRTINSTNPIANQPQLKLKISHRDVSKLIPIFETSVFSTSITDWTLNSWQHFSVIFKNKTLQLFINAEKVGQIVLKGNQRITNIYQNAFFIGIEAGYKFGLNKEIGYVSGIFNGKISDIRVFNYAFNPYDLKAFINASDVGEDLYWQVPMPMTQYVEQINRFFKHKLPGAKSQMFNIKLHGTQVTDPTTQRLIEEEIKALVTDQKPAYTDLLNFQWIS